MLISEKLRKMSIVNDKDSFFLSVNVFCFQFHCFRSFFFSALWTFCILPYLIFLTRSGLIGICCGGHLNLFITKTALSHYKLKKKMPTCNSFGIKLQGKNTTSKYFSSQLFCQKAFNICLFLFCARCFHCVNLLLKSLNNDDSMGSNNTKHQKSILRIAECREFIMCMHGPH